MSTTKMVRSRGKPGVYQKLSRTVCWFLLALSPLPLLPALEGEFIWTDISEIQEKGLIGSPGDLREAIFHGMDGQYYRPTVFLVHSLNNAAFGANPRAFRTVNLALHCICTGALLWLLVKLRIDKEVSVICAALFAVHPLAVTCVAWTSDRTDLLSLLFSLVFLIATLDYLQQGRLRSFALGSMALLLGLGSKETAVLAIAIAPIMAIRCVDLQPRRILVSGMCHLAVACAWFGWRSVVGSNPVLSGAPLSLLERIALHGAIMHGYIMELLMPYNLSVCDAVSIPSHPGGLVVEALLVACGAFLIGKVSGNDREILIGCAMWMGLFILPFSGLLPLKHARADRYLYAALPGIILFAAQVVKVTSVQYRRARVFVLGAAILFVYFGGTSILRANRFASNKRLWTWEVARNPRCLEGHSYLAREAWIEGQYPQALAHAEAALRVESQCCAFVDNDKAALYRGLALLGMGKSEEASLALETVATNADQERARAEAAYHLGLLSFIEDKSTTAIAWLSRAIDQDLDDASLADALLLRSYIYKKQGSGALSKADYRRIQELGIVMKDTPRRKEMLGAVQQ